MINTVPAYKVLEVESHLLKEVHSPRTDEESNAMSEKDYKLYVADILDLSTKLKKAIKEKDHITKAEIARELLERKSIKRRNLRMFEVTFPRKHKILLDENAMTQQDFHMKAPSVHLASQEIEPGSRPEGYIGLAHDEFIVSFVEPPIFNGR